MYLYGISMKKLVAFLVVICLLCAYVPAQAFLFWGKKHHQKKIEKMRRRRHAAVQAKQAYRTVPHDGSTGHHEFYLLSDKEQKERDQYHLYPRTAKELKHVKRHNSPIISKMDKDGKSDNKASAEDKGGESK